MNWISLKGNGVIGCDKEQLFLYYPNYLKCQFIENAFRVKIEATGQYKIIRNVTHYIVLKPPI